MSKIKNIEMFNRPREKALKYGIDSLTDTELLAILIRCGIKGVSALELSENILKEYKNLCELFNADIYNLMKIKGIKRAKALELMAVIELSKRLSQENNQKVSQIKDAEDVYNLLKSDLENEHQEKFIVMFLNSKLNIIKKETMFLGGESSSIVDVNLLFKKAIACGARRLICAHNHPSGDVTPSQEDIAITNKIRNFSKIVQITLLDHLIIGKNNYFSFNDNQI